MTTGRTAHLKFKTNNWREETTHGSQVHNPKQGAEQESQAAVESLHSGLQQSLMVHVRHQRAFILLSRRELTSNFCFSLWWLSASWLSLRARLLSSRRRKLSKRCTPWSWRGKTSFLSCGRRETNRRTQSCLQNFKLITKKFLAESTLHHWSPV